MARGEMVGKVALVVALYFLVVVGLHAVEGEVTCDQVVSNMAPCATYLTSNRDSVPSGCCRGINSLNNAARTTPDRQAVCRCLEQTASQLSDVDPEKARSLPEKCGVNLPFEISPRTDCSTVE
ncbi:plant lipid transfer protein/Par allergen [Artemisia annua]|uniref:Non-specific lipid-transfer protein n=1 Tax=Artemisia annua TaxID=35608 RepID=A0A2U1PCP8_ARTAN|nr:plant lipid transfer protein/Par allergen [Artemisia annua]